MTGWLAGWLPIGGPGSLGMFWSKIRLWGATSTYCTCRYLGGTRGILSQVTRLVVECKLLCCKCRATYLIIIFFSSCIRCLYAPSYAKAAVIPLGEKREIQPMSMRHAPAPKQVRHCERQCGIQKKFVHSSRIAGDSSCPSPALLPSMPGRQ